MASTPYFDLIVAELHGAIRKLGGSAQPRNPEDARRALRDLGADIDLRSIVDSWQDTLDDEQILELLRDWNAGRRVFAATYAQDEALLRYPDGGEYDGQPCTCARECPAVCDGACGCECCLRAWIDAGLDELIGTSWASVRNADDPHGSTPEFA